ncbi:MAG: hypothetical protein QOD09_4719 [Bradyrhizobium sp.]|jgi:hypothetical protein|nr:hypothetical protein [Bradyrhizobium sp.]MEA2950713.1 hypothetical protein [Alphaproteobacteria bacterium]
MGTRADREMPFGAAQHGSESYVSHNLPLRHATGFEVGPPD